MSADHLLLITSDTIAREPEYYNGPYSAICEKTRDEITNDIAIEAQISYNGVVVRRLMGTEMMFPVLFLFAINDHQRELHGPPPKPERKPFQI